MVKVRHSKIHNLVLLSWHVGSNCCVFSTFFLPRNSMKLSIGPLQLRRSLWAMRRKSYRNPWENKKTSVLAVRSWYKYIWYLHNLTKIWWNCKRQKQVERFQKWYFGMYFGEVSVILGNLFPKQNDQFPTSTGKGIPKLLNLQQVVFWVTGVIQVGFHMESMGVSS